MLGVSTRTKAEVNAPALSFLYVLVVGQAYSHYKQENHLYFFTCSEEVLGILYVSSTSTSPKRDLLVTADIGLNMENIVAAVEGALLLSSR